MRIAHLTASTFFGGPERQMLGLAKSLAPDVESAFLSFSESGQCHAFLSKVGKEGFEGIALKSDTPHLWSAIGELCDEFKRLGVQVVCCHGYKANLLGRIAARRVGIPVVAVARGWTGECLKVRCYEALDRLHLRWMDHVVCVSESQAVKVRRAGVPARRITVIANAVDIERFADPDPLYRGKLLRSFRKPKTVVVGAAGRLSPEKGFDVLVRAAEIVQRTNPDVGFALFGAGNCKDSLSRQIAALGLSSNFALIGFRADLDRFMPFFDLLVLPSHTEGLPNVVLEAFAAGVPVIATAVGGTPEVVADGSNGYLVPQGDAEEMAKRIVQALTSSDVLRDMGANARATVASRFSFGQQATLYRNLFNQLIPRDVGGSKASPTSAATPATKRDADAGLPERDGGGHDAAPELQTSGVETTRACGSPQ